MAASSSQRSKRSEGATPTPVRPRRRKQPSNTTAKEGGGRNTKQQSNNETIGGGDYSFLGDDNDTIMTDSSSSQQGRVKVKAGRDKENERNHRQLKDKRTPRDNLTTITTMQRDTTKTAKAKGNNIDELNDAMARVSLGDNNNNNKQREQVDTSFEPPPLEYTMDTCPPLGYGTNQLRISTSTSTKDQLLSTLQNSIQALANMKGGQTTATIIDPTTYRVLLKNTTLLETIASTSHSLTSSPSIIIEEHSNKLVDVAKKCLKALTSLTANDDGKKKSIDNKVELALLRIAIHSLRSITPTLDFSSESSSSSKSMYEMVIKLFYHCVVIAGDACHQKFLSFGNNSSGGGGGGSTKKEDNDVVGVVLEYALLCLGSYEGLGRLLNCNSNSKQNKTNKDGSVAWDEMLPVPKNVGESFNSDTTTPTPLPQKQLVKIALESSQCAASSLLYLSLVALHVNSSSSKSSNKERGREWTIPNEFHFASGVIHEMCSGKYSGTPPMFQKILTNVTLPYILHSLLETKGSSSSKKNTVVTITNIDALRQVKKVYRILWDGARSMEEVGKLSNNSTTLRIGSLNLYCGAIIFILDALHQCFQLCNTANLSDTDQSEVNALFDRATSSAMKAAAVFEKSAGLFATSGKGSKQVESSSLTKDKKALLQFHNVVGTKLRKCTLLCCGDASSPVSASYFEYCTYRSVHLFRLTGKYALSTFTHKDAAKAMHLDDDSLMTMWTFFVVDLSLQARHGMGSSTAALSVSEKEIELIISSFEKRIIKASVTIQSRTRSMLLLAELHKEATKILSSTSDETNTEKGPFLAVMGSILDRCMAPLELMLAKSQKDASRSMNFRLSSSDIHAKSALFYTIASELSNVEEKERFFSKSDSQLQRSFDILMKAISSIEDNKIEDNTQCISAVEMFAKVSLISWFLLVIVQCVSNASSCNFPTRLQRSLERGGHRSKHISLLWRYCPRFQ